MNEDEDYDYVREQYYKLSEQSSEAIDKMMNLAIDLEHPRAFEVLGTLLKQKSEVVEKLIDLKKKRKDIEKVDAPQGQLPPGSRVTNNNVFVGSTTELQKFLQKQEEAVLDYESPGSI